MKKGTLIVISGFSGAGKGTLVKRLVSGYDRFALSISMTTRKPREGEVNGREYFFVSKEEFEANIEKNGFLEYARYLENYYGTPRAYVEEKLAEGIDVILEIEVQGALQIRRIFPEAFLLFVTPPDVETLKNRLIGRGTEDMELVNKRLKRAKEEFPEMEKYDAILINDDLDTCTKEAVMLIDAAKANPVRCGELLDKLHAGFSEI